MLLCYNHFKNQLAFPFQKNLIYPTKIPNKRPHPYPISTTFQVIPFASSKLFSCSKVGGGKVRTSDSSLHVFDSGKPHKSKFPRKDSLVKVLNCLPRGIGPTSWFCERFRNASHVISVKCKGISPTNYYKRDLTIQGLSNFPMMMV